VANLYIQETLADAAFAEGAIVTVTGEEARHAVRVSRLRVGERIAVANGVGAIGQGEVESIAKDRFTVRLADVAREPEPLVRVTLVQALAKGDRAERAVEQATEFGVDAVVPWESARSVSRWGSPGGEKAERGVAKWRRVAREAAKQSVRARVPRVESPADTAELCRRAELPGVEMLVLHPRGEEALSAWTSGGAAAGAGEIMVVVGPEGGLGDEELTALAAAGARVLRLGAAVLRTSSAGPAALAILNPALGRW